uniref:Bardet-Biedl syndrome 7 protein n=2 Tax=Meloidogyne javanica TaxID=6303 RepID=A0A915M9M8_MELJA
MGGALGSIQDKAFIACGTEVRGYSRKGKQFLAFNSNLTESIQSLYIYGIDMLIASKNSFYHFHDCVEKSHFSCSDNILDILCLPITEGGWVGRGLTPVLACADKTIKVLDGSRIVYQVPLNEVPTVLHLFCNDGGYNKQKVLFGCKNGYIGLVDLGVDFWTMCQQFETKSFGTISTIHCYPMMGEENNTQPDVLIGKDDGLIELYSVDENNNLTFRQSYQCEESITGLQGGRVGNGIHPELIVTTYTDERGNEAPEMEIKVQQMRLEIEQLEIKVKDERERFNNEMTRLNQIASEVPTNGNLIGNNTSLMAFTVNDRFELRKELACYNLSVELAIPIDYVLLQSDVKVDLLDVERNSAVISVTEPENESGNALLAVYRCQADITRMEMRIRSIEGQFGTLRLYIVPRLVPLTCKVCSYPIKPLALHERIHYFDEHRPMNTLTLTGSFSIAEAHSWLALCLAEVPERCPQAETVTFNFRSTFNGGTQLQANYSKGRVSYRSDNLSTIVILRDVISRIVSMGQIKVHIACDINEESIKKCLELIWPKLEYQSRYCSTPSLFLQKMFLSKLIKKQPFLHIFFFLNVLSSIFSTSTAAQNIQLIDPKAESRKLPKSWDSILNDWERHPSTNWWHVIVTFVFPAIGMGLFGLLIYSCVRLCKWFHARREALLLAMETRRIKRSRSRSISQKTKSRPELSIDIESKTVGGPPQIISGVHINESKSENSLGSGSLGSPSIVGDVAPAVGSLRINMPVTNYEHLHKEVDNQQIHLDRILGIITDLYIDKFKMLGQNVKHKTKELLDILKGECDLEKIVEFFSGK